MRILFCGDVVGRSGRRIVMDELPRLREALGLDLVIVNGENAAGGFGITGKICTEFLQGGADVVTLGNHSWDQRDIVSYIEAEPRLIRPLNYPTGTPGRGWTLVTTAAGASVLVVSVLGRLFMDPYDDPFAAVERLLDHHRLGDALAAIIVDFHAEASSEKAALGHLLDGRVSVVVGSHTHVPTADARVLPGGTAYQTDAGMCGVLDSVIGMVKETAVQRFMKKMPLPRLEAAVGPAILCGLLVETDDTSGLARQATPVRIGTGLPETDLRGWPENPVVP